MQGFFAFSSFKIISGSKIYNDVWKESVEYDSVHSITNGYVFIDITFEIIIMFFFIF